MSGMSKNERLRYAIIGLGHLSQVAILPAFGHSHRCKLAALFSGDSKKREKLGRKFRVPVYDYGQLEEGLTKEQIDIAYVVTPNTEHRAFTEKIAAAKVHVLCEKPMATTVEDCQAMISACHRHGVKLMIAYRLHLAPAHVNAATLAAKGKLGDLRLFQSTYTMQVKAGNIRTKAKTGGGPLFDIGIYCLNAARYLFHAEPTSVSAFAASNGDPRFREIDEMVTAVLEFPGNRLASITCSFGAQDLSELRLVGTEGLLKMDSAFHYVGPSKWTVVKGERKKKRSFAAHDQFAAEMDYFAECVQRNKEPEPSGHEGLLDVKILQAFEESARHRRPVRLRLTPKATRPHQRQQKRRPPVKSKPSLVKADAPHH